MAIESRIPHVVIPESELQSLKEEVRIGKSAFRELLKQPIAFHRSFRKITGSVTSALMLSQAYYWSDKAGKDSDGWFWKTQEEWESETGLSRNEQENSRKILKSKGFLGEKLKGAPAKMFFKVDLDKIFKAIGGASHPSMPVTSILECQSLADKSASESQTLYITETTSENTFTDEQPLPLSEELILESPEPKGNEKSKKVFKNSCDPRCADVRGGIIAAYKKANSDCSLHWGARENTLLKKFLETHDWPKDKILLCVSNRFKSAINPALEPYSWIPYLAKWLAGPLDKYGQLQNGAMVEQVNGRKPHLLDGIPGPEELAAQRLKENDRIPRMPDEKFL